MRTSLEATSKIPPEVGDSAPELFQTLQWFLAHDRGFMPDISWDVREGPPERATPPPRKIYLSPTGASTDVA